jgi:uncharacterized protein (TIGR02246 family)
VSLPLTSRPDLIPIRHQRAHSTAKENEIMKQHVHRFAYVILICLALIASPGAAPVGAQAPPQGRRQAPADITVSVPADAEVLFDGKPTVQKGTERVYRTPPLVMGEPYTYTIEVRWQVAGKPIEHTRTVAVTGGGRARVDFIGARQAAYPPTRDRNPQAEAAILNKAESFVAAFHLGDAKALAGHWATDGDYTDQTGKTLKGREAIAKAFTGLFAENKGLKLRIDSLTLNFLTPDVAVEDGVTSVIPADGAPPSRARYMIVHVKRDGEWYLGSVRDAPYTPPTNREHLVDLEWLIGEWVESGAQQGETARIAYQWGENQNYLIGQFTTAHKDLVIGGGTQRIGWDAGSKTIRSWTFEDDGSFGGGTWAREGSQWTIKASATLSDGKKMTATGFLRRIDPDTMTVDFRNRMIDGQPAESARTLTLKRVTSNGNGAAAAAAGGN